MDAIVRDMVGSTALPHQKTGTAVSLEGAPSLKYHDLRDWVVEADAIGEVRHVDGADCELDIGLATELIQRHENAPAVLFDNIPGYQSGFRVLTNFFGGARRNLVFGFPTDYDKIRLSEAIQKPLQAAYDNPIPHRVAKDGPILENVMMGNEVDILKFPTPFWHEGDGGRYIGTGTYSVTQDPEDGWINAGAYRAMIHDKASVGFHISPGKHGRMHRDKYFAMGKPIPVCMVIGGDPFTFLMTGSDVPHGTCEFDVVGAYRGTPMNVVRGEITGLPFPADAEIVLEGFSYPGNVKLEGPFGEWTGFYGSSVREGPVLDIKAVYHRNNPIILGAPPQRPPDEHARYYAIVRSAQLKDAMRRAGVPDVTAVWCHEVGTSRGLLGIAIKQRYPGHATQAGFVASQCGVGAYCGRYVVVVDDDVDVSNLEDLMWAVSFRSDPATGMPGRPSSIPRSLHGKRTAAIP
jgi:UbiD family decarboxylase